MIVQSSGVAYRRSSIPVEENPIRHKKICSQRNAARVGYVVFREDRNSITFAWSLCHPEDVFDPEMGLKIALERFDTAPHTIDMRKILDTCSGRMSIMHNVLGFKRESHDAVLSTLERMSIIHIKWKRKVECMYREIFGDEHYGKYF